MNLLPRFLSLLAMGGLFISAVGARPQDCAKNPVIWADVPDLSMLRIGENYYMSSTTMHMSPGVPIMKSKDLVNWELVSYAYEILEDNEALRLEAGRQAYGSGSWASSLQFHEGVFYVSTFSSTTGKTHVYRTKDIEKGPWEAQAFKPMIHDHSLFFEDDGRVYMIGEGGKVRLIELNADLSGIKEGGVKQVIIEDATIVGGQPVGLPAEGSQLRKINGKYYLFMITWPKGGMRTELVFRADKLTGPYEGRIFLQDQGVAQGGLIDTPEGKWYAYLFKDSGAVGRIPYLVPVTWVDAWPVAGKVTEHLDIPVKNDSLKNLVASDEFERAPGQAAFPLVWQWNHNPDNKFWSLSERPGQLRLRNGRVDTGFLAARNTLTQRTFGPQCQGTVALDVSQMKDGDYAGLAALQKKFGFVGVRMKGGSKSVVMVSAETGQAEEMASMPLGQETVFLKVACDFRAGADKALFYFSLDGRNWTVMGKPLQMSYTLPHFMGYRFGLFSYATKTAGGFVDFDYFRITE